MQISCEYLDRWRLAETRRAYSESEYCDRISFFPGGTTWHPHPNLFRSLLVFEEPRNLGRERFESSMVPKEIGNAYEKILNQRARFAGLVTKKSHIIWQAFDSIKLHSTANPPQNRCPLVVSKIAAGACSQKGKNVPQSCVVPSRGGRGSFRLWLVRGFFRKTKPPSVVQKFYQSFRHLPYRQYPVHHARRDRSPRHSRVLSFRWLLRNCKPSMFLDPLDADCSIRICSGEHYTDRVLSLGLAPVCARRRRWPLVGPAQARDLKDVAFHFQSKDVFPAESHILDLPLPPPPCEPQSPASRRTVEGFLPSGSHAQEKGAGLLQKPFRYWLASFRRRFARRRGCPPILRDPQPEAFDRRARPNRSSTTFPTPSGSSGKGLMVSSQAWHALNDKSL